MELLGLRVTEGRKGYLFFAEQVKRPTDYFVYDKIKKNALDFKMLGSILLLSLEL